MEKQLFDSLVEKLKSNINMILLEYQNGQFENEVKTEEELIRGIFINYISASRAKNVHSMMVEIFVETVNKYFPEYKKDIQKLLILV